ncbi:hypothetical protein [Nitrosomonas sp.]|uniref:hypothetical protein n=1 Tax=Nitrosomonas sp. TaxID=42353 RepID=UPI002086190B|nr:hypothetical protein [Nitrosomonas sp.]GJL74232.1 MAG: hypothetical protein NMNS02_03380 [Nitrosomonas sp.]
MSILVKTIFILLLLMNTGVVRSENAHQGGYPIYSYKDGTLTVPRVDVPGQVGRYQDVVFQFDSQINAWVLREHHSRETMPESPKLTMVIPAVSSFFPVDSINTSSPTFVRLIVLGEYTCGRIGQVNQRRTVNLFEIQITQDPLQPTEVCDHKVREFWRIINLDVFGLKAGDYQYTINNGENNGSFTLPLDVRDSAFTDCGGSPEDDSNNCEDRIVPF